MIHHDIETESLPAHVSICQERYQALEHRFIEVENKIDRINMSLLEIKHEIERLGQRHNDSWNTAQIAVIGVLASIVGALGGRLLLG